MKVLGQYIYTLSYLVSCISFEVVAKSAQEQLQEDLGNGNFTSTCVHTL